MSLVVGRSDLYLKSNMQLNLKQKNESYKAIEKDVDIFTHSQLPQDCTYVKWQDQGPEERLQCVQNGCNQHPQRQHEAEDAHQPHRLE